MNLVKKRIKVFATIEWYEKYYKEISNKKHYYLKKNIFIDILNIENNKESIENIYNSILECKCDNTWYIIIGDKFVYDDIVIDYIIDNIIKNNMIYYCNINNYNWPKLNKTSIISINSNIIQKTNSVKRKKFMNILKFQKYLLYNIKRLDKNVYFVNKNLIDKNISKYKSTEIDPHINKWYKYSVLDNYKFNNTKIDMKNVKYKEYKPCVCMCLYTRPENLEPIFSALENQTYKNFEFFIWNNRPDLKDWIDIVAKHHNIETKIYHSEHNMGSYARLLIPPMTENNPIMFLDDDRIPHKDFVEYNLQRYIKFPFAIQSSWAWQQPNDYWGSNSGRKRIINEDIEVDYCGTAGMVLDKSIFENEEMYNIPDEYKNIEDLWICYIARVFENRPLYSMKLKMDVVKDNKDQYTSMVQKKIEMYRWIKSKGFKTVSDKKLPNISIIIVSYNRWKLTKKCIDSIVQNTPKDVYEIIVVDNASDYDTIKELKVYNNMGYIHKLILNEENYQLGKGFNIGYEYVDKNVDYVMTLNNDHFVMNGWYYNVLSSFKNKSIDFVASTIRGGSFHIKDEIIDKNYNYRYLVINKNKNIDIKEKQQILSGNEIGEGLVFRSKYIFNNIIKWSDDKPGNGWLGSYHTRLLNDIIKPNKLKGVELGRPAALTQKNDDMAVNKDYYIELFNSRGKKLPTYDYHYDIIKDKEEYYKWTDYLNG